MSFSCIIGGVLLVGGIASLLSRDKRCRETLQNSAVVCLLRRPLIFPVHR